MKCKHCQHGLPHQGSGCSGPRQRRAGAGSRCSRRQGVARRCRIHAIASKRSYHAFNFDAPDQLGGPAPLILTPPRPRKRGWLKAVLFLGILAAIGGSVYYFAGGRCPSSSKIRPGPGQEKERRQEQVAQVKDKGDNPTPIRPSPRTRNPPRKRTWPRIKGRPSSSSIPSRRRKSKTRRIQEERTAGRVKPKARNFRAAPCSSTSATTCSSIPWRTAVRAVDK